MISIKILKKDIKKFLTENNIKYKFLSIYWFDNELNVILETQYTHYSFDFKPEDTYQYVYMFCTSSYLEDNAKIAA